MRFYGAGKLIEHEQKHSYCAKSVKNLLNMPVPDSVPQQLLAFVLNQSEKEKLFKTIDILIFFMKSMPTTYIAQGLSSL